MIVPDASVILEVLLRTPDAEGIEARIFLPDETLHAPHLLDLEVAQVLRRYVSQRQITEARGAEALADLGDFPITRYPHTIFLPRVWELRGNLTAYDAVYIALAEALDASLVTRDSGLASATGHGAHIDLV